MQAFFAITLGAVYCDKHLRASGFNGEKVHGSSVLVVKHHTEHPRWTIPTEITELPQVEKVKVSVGKVFFFFKHIEYISEHALRAYKASGTKVMQMLSNLK